MNKQVVVLSVDHIAMRDACFRDVTHLIRKCIEDTLTEDGKNALRDLGAAINDQGVDGFGMEGTVVPQVNHEKQFSYEVREGDEVIGHGQIDDPFIVTQIWAKGWKRFGLAWSLLWHSHRWTVRVSGTPEAHRVIFQGDYTPAPPGPAQEMQAVGEVSLADKAGEGYSEPRRRFLSNLKPTS